MKKLLIFFIVCYILFSHKNENRPSKNYPSGTEQISGILKYDNFPDGWGLYYATDHENLIFKNEFSCADSQNQDFKQYAGVNTRLYLLSGVIQLVDMA